MANKHILMCIPFVYIELTNTAWVLVNVAGVFWSILL